MIQKVAYLTSGGKGLGHATVKVLLQAGWDVFFTYGQSRLEADRLLRFAEQMGRTAAAASVNLLDRRAVESSIQACVDRFGRIDALIHNFGPFIFDRIPAAAYTDDMWTQMLDGNLTNFFWMYRLLIPGMRERQFGRVVTIGYDGAGDAEGWRYRAAYAAAKAGLAAMTRSIAKEEREHGITANMVCPGDIRGAAKMKMIDEVVQADRPSLRPPVGEDVGRMVVYLCDERSQQINGTVTSVTGGYEIISKEN